MAYCSVAELKRELDITSNSDDALLESIIGRAQAAIDRFCDRTFEASANTNRTFDAIDDVDGRTLFLDQDLCEINSITNGDSTSVTSGQYVTEPRNETPYYAITIRSDQSFTWTYNDYHEDAITVSGKWAYSTTAPDDINHVALRLSAYLYRQRDNAQDLERPVVVGMATYLPARLPSDIQDLLRPYKRITAR